MCIVHAQNYVLCLCSVKWWWYNDVIGRLETIVTLDDILWCGLLAGCQTRRRLLIVNKSTSSHDRSIARGRTVWPTTGPTRPLIYHCGCVHFVWPIRGLPEHQAGNHGTSNSLPAKVTSSNSLQTFKAELKSHLFLASFPCRNYFDCDF